MAPRSPTTSADPDQRRRRAHAKRILAVLEREHPDARCALDWKDPFELAVATILSAQCTDARVNSVTPALFARFPSAASLGRAGLPEVEEIIRSTGFFRAKAKSIVGFAKGIASRPSSDLPRNIDELIILPGIGRKTANVVLGHAFGVNQGIAVDTHVLRVTNRLGLGHGDDPLVVERELMALFPEAQWTRVTDLLIFHGRRICDARRPACGRCPLFPLCDWDDRGAWSTTGARPERSSAARPHPALGKRR